MKTILFWFAALTTLLISATLDFLWSDSFLISPFATAFWIWGFARYFVFSCRLLVFIQAVWILFLWSDLWLAVSIALIGYVSLWFLHSIRIEYGVYPILGFAYQFIWMGIHGVEWKGLHLLPIGLWMLVALHFKRFSSITKRNLGSRRDLFSKRFHIDRKKT